MARLLPPPHSANLPTYQVMLSNIFLHHFMRGGASQKLGGASARSVGEGLVDCRGCDGLQTLQQS